MFLGFLPKKSFVSFVESGTYESGEGAAKDEDPGPGSYVPLPRESRFKATEVG